MDGPRDEVLAKLKQTQATAGDNTTKLMRVAA
jgi:hypothetical protein